MITYIKVNLDNKFLVQILFQTIQYVFNQDNEERNQRLKDKEIKKLKNASIADILTQPLYYYKQNTILALKEAYNKFNSTVKY